MRVILIAALISVLLLGGCSSGDTSPTPTSQPLLHLRGYDVYPNLYRATFKAFADLAVARNEQSFCNTIDWASVTPEAVIEAFKGDLGQFASALGEPRPAQTANPRDDVAAALIILDECHRVAP